MAGFRQLRVGFMGSTLTESGEMLSPFDKQQKPPTSLIRSGLSSFVQDNKTEVSSRAWQQSDGKYLISWR